MIKLNKAIALLLFQGSAEALDNYEKNTEFPNYCNNWNDLMPWVEKYRLVIVPYKDDLWEAYPGSGEFATYNKKYLMAGAECLLRLLEGK